MTLIARYLPMHTISQRQIVLTILGFASVIACLMIPYTWITLRNDTILLLTVCCGAISFGGLWLAYWRGWDQARYLTVAIMTFLATFGVPTKTEFIPAMALIVPILALVLTRPSWVIGSAICQILLLITHAYLTAGGSLTGMAAFGDIGELLLYMLAIVGLVLSRVMLDTLLQSANESAHRDAQARARAELQAQELAEQAIILDRQVAEQRRLLDLVAVLETPAVSLADGVLLAPVVGALDSRRIQDLTTRLLQMVSYQRTQMVVLDIAGVPAIDTEVAHALLNTVQSLRLLGCKVTLTGISAAVAASLTGLGVSLGDVPVARSPKEVLRALVA